MDDVLRTYDAVGQGSAHDFFDSFIHSSWRSREAEAGRGQSGCGQRVDLRDWKRTAPP